MPKISELTQLLNPTGAELIPVADGSYTKHVTAASLLALAGGGATVTVSDDAPAAENEGDLWYTPTDGSLYVWVEGSLNAWVQTNGGGGDGANVTVSDTAPADAGEGDLWFDDVNATLYVYLADTTNAWIAIGGGGQSGSTGGGGNWSTGWVDTDGTTSVGSGATMTFAHDLGADALNSTFSIYGAYDANGTNMENMEYFFWASSTNDAHQSRGVQIKSITSTDVTIQLGSQAYTVNSSGVYNTVNWGPGNVSHIKLVLSSGGGSSGGGASVTTGTTTPASPADGDLWFDETVAELYVYLASESAWVQTNGGGAGGSSYSSGWVNTDGTTSVADGATLNFTHNLGTTDVVFDVYVADNASGDNAFRVGDAQDAGFNTAYGASIQSITASSFVLQLGSGGTHGGAMTMNSSGDKSFLDYTGKYIKVVAISGGGGGGSGPRAYVAFDGVAADLTASITNSHNVASITDNGVGVYTINYTNNVPNPVITLSHDFHYRTPTIDAPMDVSYTDHSNASFQILVGESESAWPSNVVDVFISAVVH